MSEDKQQSAFPHPKDGGVWGSDLVPGMTLRDWFATHAPENPPHWFASKVNEHYQCIETQEMRYFRWRYAYADFMMAEREKK